MAQFPFRDFLRDTDDGKKALTTANHVMTEGGVWIPQRGSDDGSVNTQLTGSFMEYRILSTDPIPEAKSDEKGATLIVMDTGEVKMNHGGTWGDF